MYWMMDIAVMEIEKMDDLISRQAAIDDLHGKDPSQVWDTADGEVWINALPSADVQPVRHGHWIHILTEEDGNALYECSVCHKGEVHVPIVEVSYCWNCGARMDGEKDG